MPQSVTLEFERERLTKEHIAALVQPFAKKYGIKAIWLFGSRARGDNRPDSDVDLLIRFRRRGSQ